MTRRLPRLLTAAVVLASALAVTGCAGAAQPAPTASDAAAPPPNSPVPTVAPTQTSVPAAEPTCDTIISPSTVETLKGVGWTAKSEPLRLGSLVIDEGIQCTWGNYTIATDHVQIYGWAPIDADTATTAQQELVKTGWLREDAPEGIYITEGESTAISPDAEGYGLTYLFGDGWVKYSDTKQGLVLIEWPKS